MQKPEIADLQKFLEISFLQEALFELVEEKHLYTPLLVVNHHNSYLSLSNENHYLFLLTSTIPEHIAEVCEDASNIFNRKKILVQLEQCEDIIGFEHHFCIKVFDLILQAEKNEVPKHNLFLPQLLELFSRDFRTHTEVIKIFL